MFPLNLCDTANRACIRLIYITSRLRIGIGTNSVLASSEFKLLAKTKNYMLLFNIQMVCSVLTERK